ncbi:MAG: hypothetical protein AAGF32_05680, partial [Pseudomonadota bacterium]
KVLKISLLWPGDTALQVRLRGGGEVGAPAAVRPRPLTSNGSSLAEALTQNGGPAAQQRGLKADVLMASAHLANGLADGRRKLTMTSALARLPSNVPIVNEVMATDVNGQPLCPRPAHAGAQSPGDQPVRRVPFEAVLTVPGNPPQRTAGVLELGPCVANDAAPAWIAGALPNIVLE